MEIKKKKTTNLKNKYNNTLEKGNIIVDEKEVDSHSPKTSYT